MTIYISDACVWSEDFTYCSFHQAASSEHTLPLTPEQRAYMNSRTQGMKRHKDGSYSMPRRTGTFLFGLVIGIIIGFALSFA